jgi:hypothetical protein
LIAGVLFGFGHHALTDPLYPWIASSLLARAASPDQRGERLRRRVHAYLTAMHRHFGE